MSKFYLLLFFIGAFSGNLLGQGHLAKAPQALEKAPNTKYAILPEENTPEMEDPNTLYLSGANYRTAEEVVSLLRWDAQSYGCVPSRLFANSDGNPTAAWIFSTDGTGAFPERGTGYNTRENGLWPAVTSRVETARTGFPAIARTANGTELIVSHNTGANPWAIQITRKAAGSSAWTEANLMNPPGNVGLLWPRIATGGPDGETVHVIAITTPVANGGVVYEGMDAHLLYWRSLDGGVTWDINAAKIPGIDSDKFSELSADSYTIDVNGEGIAVVVFPGWNDTRLVKSIDNGSSWEDPITVVDFPDALENYAGNAGDAYTFDDIGYFDPNAPDSLAVFSSDGFGAVILDDSYQAHVWFGRMYYIDNDPADGSFYYPGINGLMYWNESMGENNSIELTGALDYDGDTLLNISSTAEIGPYFNSLSSFPSVGTDADGNIYLAYSAVHELYRSDWGAEVDQFYRHVYLMKSEDNGASWGEPYDITSVPYVDEFFVAYTEAVWPSIQRNIGDAIWLVYQNDNTPGTNIWGANHSNMEAGYVFVEVEKDSLPVFTSLFEAQKPTLDMQLVPNPVSSMLRIETNLPANGKVAIQVIDMYGRMVKTFHSNVPSGPQTLSFPVADLPAGTYQVLLRQGTAFGSQLLLKN